MKRVIHWWNYLTSKSYRKHDWLRKNLFIVKLSYGFIYAIFLYSPFSDELLKMYRSSVIEGRKGNRMRKTLDRVIAQKRSQNDT